MMAGAGSTKSINDIKRLVATYGGEAKDWAKMTTEASVELKNKIAIKNDRKLQIHWYENTQTGQKVEHKGIIRITVDKSKNK